MDWNRRIITAFALASLAGCSSMGRYREMAQPGQIVEYRAGVASRAYESGSETVPLAREAMEDVGIHSINEVHERETIVLEGKTVDSRRASVSIASQGGRSVVSAKIGILGDEALSRAILDRLAALVGDRPGTRPIDTSKGAEAEKKPRRPIISRDGVSDEFMLKGQAEAGYRDSPVP